MFVVDEAMAEAVQRAFDEQGEWPAVAELRRHMPMADNANALRTVRTIAFWRLRPDPARQAPTE
ncbi:hypothetical protein [Azospirillum sp. B510]|uniref:hypothetical protein n=1 Tax=Azospirillum sp. (strain B510) TaxID=137722 RepID=UPI0002DE18CD|nr:hypothetical protein [Azospirillum sp. B510]